MESSFSVFGTFNPSILILLAGTNPVVVLPSSSMLANNQPLD